MAIETNHKPRRSVARRVTRLASFGFYCGLLLWIVWLAATRWNGVPANPNWAFGVAGYTRPIDPQLDRTQELTAAMAAIPTPGPLVLPPAPPGMQWRGSFSTVVSMHDVVRGEWTPETRAVLQSAIGFLQTSAVDSAIEKLAAIAPGAWNPQIGGVQQVRPALFLLLARARYYHAEVGDIDAAIADYAIAYRLLSIVNNSRDPFGPMVIQTFENYANTELIHLAGERTLTPGQLTRILELVRNSLPNKADQWQAAIEPQCEAMELSLDSFYTDDGHGNGWLVLSRFDQLGQPAPAVERRSGAWNALSPLFNSRRTVAAKIAHFRRLQEEARDAPFAEAMDLLQSGGIPFGVADGPLCATGSYWTRTRQYLALVRCISRRHATIVTIALSAYRIDHGDYPASLRELDEKYLACPDLDPYSDRPFRYERRDDGYILYSVGPNQVDDGGRTHSRKSRTWGSTPDGDWLFTEPRREPRLETTLEKA